VLTLPSVLDLKAASGLHRDLIELRGQDLNVDGGEVSRLGAQCLQVLMAGVIAWRKDARRLGFVNRSEAFDRALNLFGADLDTLQKEPLA
jgi:chemotaxis protein CheX